jgi:hypothetical protein
MGMWEFVAAALAVGGQQKKVVEVLLSVAVQAGVSRLPKNSTVADAAVAWNRHFVGAVDVEDWTFRNAAADLVLVAADDTPKRPAWNLLHGCCLVMWPHVSVGDAVLVK